VFDLGRCDTSPFASLKAKTYFQRPEQLVRGAHAAGGQ